MQQPGASFDYDRQSRSNVIGFGDKLVYSMVFYGERKYKLFLCTSDDFTPVHYTLRDSFTKELIYDNKRDDYSETVTFSNEYTRKLLLEIEVLAEDATEDVKMSFLGCSGVLVYFEEKEDSRKR